MRGGEWSWVFCRVSHGGSGDIMSYRCVDHGARQQICAQWIQALSLFLFSTWFILSFVFMTVNSPIQGKCDDWAMDDCGRWIKTLSSTCIRFLLGRRFNLASILWLALSLAWVTQWWTFLKRAFICMPRAPGSLFAISCLWSLGRCILGWN